MSWTTECEKSIECINSNYYGNIEWVDVIIIVWIVAAWKFISIKFYHVEVTYVNVILNPIIIAMYGYFCSHSEIES